METIGPYIIQGELGRGDLLPMWAGQGVGLARDEAAAQLVERLVRETVAAAGRLPGA